MIAYPPVTQNMERLQNEKRLKHRMSPLNPLHSPLSNRPHTPPLLRPSPLSNNLNSFEGSEQTTLTSFINSNSDSDQISTIRKSRHQRTQSNRYSPTKTINSAQNISDEDLVEFNFSQEDGLEKESISCPDLLHFVEDSPLPCSKMDLYIEKSRKVKAHKFRKHVLEWPSWKDSIKEHDNGIGLGLVVPSIDNKSPRISHTATRSQSDGDLSAYLSHFFYLRESLTFAKDQCDSELKCLLHQMNSVVETYVEQNEGQGMQADIDCVIDLAEVCGEIISMDVIDLLAPHICEHITQTTQQYMANWTCAELPECASFPLRVLIIFSQVTLVVERMNLSEDISLLKYIKVQKEDTSPIYDTNDDTDDQSEFYDDDVHSGSDKQSVKLRTKSRSSQRSFRKHSSEQSKSSPLSSPSHMNLFASQLRPPFSPTKSIDKSDTSLFTKNLNMTLEFNQNLDLIYISPCVLDSLGYEAADMITQNTLTFTELVDQSLQATITYAKNDLGQESTVPSCQIFQSANEILLRERCKQMQISFSAKTKNGDIVSMEGQGMILEQNSKATLIWVTRCISYQPETKMDILTDLGLCSICDRNIPVTLFAGHAKLCSAAHHADMELSFCNDSLKVILVDLLEKREMIGDERSNQTDKQICHGYLNRLDTLYDQTLKLIDELLSIRHSGVWSGEFNLFTTIKNVPVELLVTSLNQLESPKEEDYIELWINQIDHTDELPQTLIGLGYGLFQIKTDVTTLAKHKLVLLNECRDSSDKYKTAVYLEESIKNQIQTGNDSGSDNFSIFPMSDEIDQIVNTPPDFNFFHSTSNFSNQYLRRFSEQVQRRQSVNDARISSKNLTVSTSALRLPRVLLGSDKSDSEPLKSPGCGSPLSGRFFGDDSSTRSSMYIKTPIGSSTSISNLASYGQPLTRINPSIKDYDILKPISKGAFGAVYLARKKQTSDYFAIKVLKKSDMIAKNQVTNIKSERMILTQLDSPFVVKMYYSFQSKNNLYLVMEYLNGGDCGALLKSIGCLEEKWARQYIAEITLGLEFLHSRGIIHRDLKPDNLLIDCRGHLKVTDFGLSKAGFLGRRWNGPVDSVTSSMTGLNVTSTLTKPDLGFNLEIKHTRRGSTVSNISASSIESSNVPKYTSSPISKQSKFVGTPDYLSPESVLGLGQDSSVDWWAAGVILYEFLYGIPAFHSDTPQLVFENIIARRIDWKLDEYDVSPEAIDLMDKLMCTNVTDRLGTAEGRLVKQHPFFADVDWSKVLEENGEFVPNIKDATDTDYFDDRGAKANDFTKEENDLGSDQLIDVDEDQNTPDFGEAVYKNLPLLEKANNDLLAKLKNEGFESNSDHFSDTESDILTSTPALPISDSFKEEMPTSYSMRFNRSLEHNNPNDFARRSSLPTRIRTSSLTGSTLQILSPTISLQGSDKNTRIFGRANSGCSNDEFSAKSLCWHFDGRNFITSKPLHILIADYNPLTCKIMMMILNTSGANCDIVYNGAEALNKAMGGQKYDLIFMDVRMPILDGEGAAKLIRNSSNVNKDTPIIGMTSYDFTPTEYFTKVIFKPLKKDKVIKVVMKLTESF